VHSSSKPPGQPLPEVVTTAIDRLNELVTDHPPRMDGARRRRRRARDHGLPGMEGQHDIEFPEANLVLLDVDQDFFPPTSRR
jgi:hypothetical protein